MTSGCVMQPGATDYQLLIVLYWSIGKSLVKVYHKPTKLMNSPLGSQILF